MQIPDTIHADKAIRMVPVFKEPKLIAVRAIKAKYVEQMPRHQKDIPDGCVVIGTVSQGAFIIAQAPNGHLFKVHHTDWVNYLIVTPPGGNFNVVHEAAAGVVQNYPQLFED